MNRTDTGSISYRICRIGTGAVVHCVVSGTGTGAVVDYIISIGLVLGQ